MDVLPSPQAQFVTPPHPTPRQYVPCLIRVEQRKEEFQKRMDRNRRALLSIDGNAPSDRRLLDGVPLLNSQRKRINNLLPFLSAKKSFASPEKMTETNQDQSFPVQRKDSSVTEERAGGQMSDFHKYLQNLSARNLAPSHLSQATYEKRRISALARKISHLQRDETSKSHAKMHFGDASLLQMSVASRARLETTADTEDRPYGASNAHGSDTPHQYYSSARKKVYAPGDEYQQQQQQQQSLSQRQGAKGAGQTQAIRKNPTQDRIKKLLGEMVVLSPSESRLKTHIRGARHVDYGAIAKRNLTHRMATESSTLPDDGVFMPPISVVSQLMI